MKQLIIGVGIIVLLVSSIVFSLTVWQTRQEEQRLKQDLKERSTLLAETLRETIEPRFIDRSDAYLETAVKKFTNRERIRGIAVYDNNGIVVFASSEEVRTLPSSLELVARAMDSDSSKEAFISQPSSRLYYLALPLHNALSIEGSVVGAIGMLQNADYIRQQVFEIWKRNLFRLFTNAILLSIALALLFRYIIARPLQRIVGDLKLVRMGVHQSSHVRIPRNRLFRPLLGEIFFMRKNLIEARLRASEEARLRMEKVDSPWTAERLKELLKDILKDRKLVVVSNREPYVHVKEGDDIRYFFPASGMATALEPLMQACGGVWVAHGSGNADPLVTDREGHIPVPPDEPKYTLRRLWLNEEEEQKYYYGFSNEGIWPLCHNAHIRPVFRKEDWSTYQKVNQKFADTVLEEISEVERPLVFVQDYLLALVPRLVKQRRPDAVVGLFWHVPWPNAEAFSICPYRAEILDGMLGADLIGFHTQLYCNNFIDTVGRTLEALIDWEDFTVTRGGHGCLVKPFPISIPLPDDPSFHVSDQTVQFKEKDIRKELSIQSRFVGVGVDRMDYVKGLVERCRALEAFFEKYPAYRSQFTFVQIAPVSRSKIQEYQELESEVTAEVERINQRFASNQWKPIVLLKKRHNHEELRALYRSADVCMVTSLHDGMNIVAKEFVATKEDGRGALILSQFAGAADELRDALIVNPYNIEEVADALKKALELPVVEQRRRMRKMQEVVRNDNVYRWSAEILRTMASLE